MKLKLDSHPTVAREAKKLAEIEADLRTTGAASYAATENLGDVHVRRLMQQKRFSIWSLTSCD